MQQPLFLYIHFTNRNAVARFFDDEIIIGNLCFNSINLTHLQIPTLQICKNKEILYIMKATGIVRRIDDLGRVVIPKEIRRTMRIREGDPSDIR